MATVEPSADKSQLHILNLSAAEFLKLREDEHFRRILVLASIANSLRFSQVAAFSHSRGDDPNANRQRIGSFLYSTGLLCTGIRWIDEQQQFFADSKSFQKNLAPLLDDPVVQDLWQQTKHRKGLLRRLRDQAVFHHDDQVFREGLLRLEAQAEGFEFVSYQGSVEQTYFAFVDQVIMQYAVGEGAIVEMSNAEFLKQLGGL